MKQKPFFVMLILLLMVLPLTAKQVSVSDAEEIGKLHLSLQQETWLAQADNGINNHDIQSFSVIDTVPFMDDTTGDLLYYVLHLSPQGFIVVSPENGINPVTAYSYYGNFPASQDSILQQLLKLDITTRSPLQEGEVQLAKHAAPEQWPPTEHVSYNKGWLQNDSATALGGIVTYWQNYDNIVPLRQGTATSAIQAAATLKEELRFASVQLNDNNNPNSLFQTLNRNMRNGWPVQLEVRTGHNIIADGFRLTAAGDAFYHLNLPSDVWYALPVNGSLVASVVMDIHPDFDRHEPNNTRGEAYPIMTDQFANNRLTWHSFGNTQLKSAGDKDWFRFDAQNGERVTVTCHAVTSDFNAVVSLYKNDELITRELKKPNAGKIKFSHNVLDSGTYFVSVSANREISLNREKRLNSTNSRRLNRCLYNLEIKRDDFRPLPPKELLSILISGPSSVDEDSSANYTCRAYYDDDSSQDVTNYTTFTSSSPSVAFFEGHGILFTENVSSNQSITVTAAYSNKTRNKSVTVVNVALSSVSVSGASSLYENTSQSYTATANYTNGSSKSITSTASWSNTSAYASMSGNTLNAGSVTSNQSDTVIATYSEGGITKSGTKGVTIVNYITLISLTVFGPGGINENSSGIATAYAYFDDGSSQNVSSYAYWSGFSSYHSVGSGGWIWTNEVPYTMGGFWVSASYTYNGVTKSDSSVFTIYDTPW